MTEYAQGMIQSALGGFYYVLAENGTLYACKARGLFRNQGVSPLVGDRVRIQITGESTGQVEEIFPRANSLIRPPVANIDALCMVASVVSPPPNLLVLDKIIAIAEHKGIEPVVVVTKTDLGDESACESLCALYRGAGFAVFALSARTGEGVEPLKGYLAGKLTCLCGNTGAGKSSLLNAIDPHLALETSEISRKLGRGRHTTRHAELYPLEGGGFIADTAGFSAVETSRYEVIFKEDLENCFREFAPYLGKCRFTGCSHTSEAGCAVLAAVREGEIAESRLQSYIAMYEEAKMIKKWELGEKCGK